MPQTFSVSLRGSFPPKINYLLDRELILAVMTRVDLLALDMHLRRSRYIQRSSVAPFSLKERAVGIASPYRMACRLTGIGGEIIAARLSELKLSLVLKTVPAKALFERTSASM